MEYTKLSNFNCQVSRIVFGCEPLGGTDWGTVDLKMASRAVIRALDLGVNFFDTADVYGLGQSEKVLADALGVRRHDVIIATKFGVAWRDCGGDRAVTYRDSSPRRVTEAIEASLRRLRLESIPLIYIHWPDPNTPVAATMEALLKCKESGKIQHIGVSNFSAEQIREANRHAPISCVQLQYSLIDRKAENDILPCCQELGLSVIVYGPLAQGLLTGKYGVDARFGSNDRRHRLPHFQKENLAKHQVIIDRLRNVSQLYGKSLAQVAVRWVLDHPAVSAAIVGTKTPAQIEENVGATGWSLRPEDYQSLAG